MKPNEFIKQQNKINLKDWDWYNIGFKKTIEELNSHFIDKKELREKINKLINNNIKENIINFEVITKKEILKLLEE